MRMRGTSLALVALMTMPDAARATGAVQDANALDGSKALIDKLPELLQLGAIGLAAVGLLLAFSLEMAKRPGAARFMKTVVLASAMFLGAELLKPIFGWMTAHPHVHVTRSPLSAFGGMQARPSIWQGGKTVDVGSAGISLVCDERIDLTLGVDEMVVEYGALVAARDDLSRKLNASITNAAPANEDQQGFDPTGGAP